MVYSFSAGRIDTVVALGVAKIVLAWTWVTGRSQMPLAYGCLATGMGLFGLATMQVVRSLDPYLATMFLLLVSVWSINVALCIRMLHRIALLELFVDGDTVDIQGPYESFKAVQQAVNSRRIYGGLTLLYLLVGATVIVPATLGLSTACYVACCITPGGGAPVWTRAARRMQKAVRRLAPAPVPAPA